MRLPRLACQQHKALINHNCMFMRSSTPAKSFAPKGGVGLQRKTLLQATWGGFVAKESRLQTFDSSWVTPAQAVSISPRYIFHEADPYMGLPYGAQCASLLYGYFRPASYSGPDPLGTPRAALLDAF